MPGDRIYAACCKYALETYTEQRRGIAREFANWSAIRNGYISVLKATAARLMDGDPEELACAEKRLKAAMQSAPPVWPKRTGKLKSIGVPAGYDA